MRVRRNSFEDVAVGFENETTAEEAHGQARLVAEEEDVAFDEITQQIASLTQTVNELRFKHRRPVVGQCDDDVPARRSGRVFRGGGGTRKQR